MDNKKIYKICNDIVKNMNNIIRDGGATIDKEGAPSQLKSGFYASVEGMEQTISLKNIDFEILKNEIIKKLQYINTYKKTFLRILDRRQSIIY